MATMDVVKTACDFAACGITVASLASWLPPVAALLTIIWTALRILETITGKTIPQMWRRE